MMVVMMMVMAMTTSRQVIDGADWWETDLSAAENMQLLCVECAEVWE